MKISRPLKSPAATQMMNSQRTSNDPNSNRQPDDIEGFNQDDEDPLMPYTGGIDAKDIKTFLRKESSKVQLFFLRTKRPTTYSNLFALLVAPIVAYVSARYLQYKGNTSSGFEENETYVLITDISLAFLMLFVFIGFDLLGRAIVLITAGVFLALVVAIYPYLMPFSHYLAISNFASVCPWTVLSLSPLVIDYVKQESRGMALSLAMLSIPLGEVTAVGVIYLADLCKVEW